MRVLIRTDVSEQIGSGHLMRSLTLANEVAARGGSVCFAIRTPSEDCMSRLTAYNHSVRPLLAERQISKDKFSSRAYSEWLPVPQATDAVETLAVIQDFRPDLVVVDHYALDVSWHSIVKLNCANIMVVDDLADRLFDCRFLLNQNIGAHQENYKDKVVSECTFFTGPRFALLRKEFLDWRGYSLKRRSGGEIKNVLITMGGVDASNYTLAILKELRKSKRSQNCSFTIVTGSLYPHLNELMAFAAKSQMNISVLSNVTNIAEIMANSDLCIGAAGSSTWERCSLGLPTLTVGIADNQNIILTHLKKNLIAIVSCLTTLCDDFEEIKSRELVQISKRSAGSCDGLGVVRVIDHLETEIVRTHY